MTIYVTARGEQLFADSPVELVDQLQQLRGEKGETKQDFMDRIAREMAAIQGTIVHTADPATFIAELIQNDYLSVVDSIDG